MDIAFLGTGLLGRPMAERLLACGHRLTVFNRTRSKAEPLAERGAALAPSAATAIAAAPVAVAVVSDAAAVGALLFSGEPRPDLAGRTVLQASTIGPGESRELAKRVNAAGGSYLETPVLGSRPQAAAGKLLVMAGGEEADFERWRPLLGCLGEAPRRVGPVGAAVALKLALNQLIAAEIAGFASSLGLVRRSGLDPAVFMEVLRQSALYAPAFDGKLSALLARRFGDANFTTRLLLKDVELIRGEARALGMDTRAVDGIREVVATAVEAGLGDLDYASIYEVIDPRA